MSIIIWLIIINVAVFLHELAHYLAAKVQGVPVHSFSLGMGQVLWRKQWRETEWRISMLPIGGYVEIEGMAPSQDKDGNTMPPNSGYAKLSWLGKVFILVAGPIANIFLAIALYSGVLVAEGETRAEPGPAKLEQVMKGHHAEREGLMAGDLIVAVNGKAVQSPDDVRQDLRRNGKHSFKIQRSSNGTTKTFDVNFEWSPAPTPENTRPLFGVQIVPAKLTKKNYNLPEAIAQSSSTLVGGIPSAVNAFVGGAARVFTFAKTDANNPNEVVGPIGTIQTVDQVAKQQHFGSLVLLAAIINFSLGLFNLFPIPGLDGGRILLATLVLALRRPLKPGQEEFINFIGFAFVLVFIALVTLRDVTRLVGG